MRIRAVLVALCTLGAALAPAPASAAVDIDDLLNDPPIGYEGIIVSARVWTADAVFDRTRGRTYISSDTGNLVMSLQTADYSGIDAFDVSGRPGDLELLADGDTMVVANSNPAEVIVVDLDSFSINRRIDLEGRFDRVVQIAEVQPGVLIVAGQGDTNESPVVRVDLSDDSVLEMGGGVELPRRQVIYANHGDDTAIIGTTNPEEFHEFDVATGTLLRSHVTGEHYSADKGLKSADGEWLFLSSGDVISVADWSRVGSLPWNDSPLALSDDGTRLYATIASYGVTVVDAVTLEVLDTFAPACAMTLSLGRWIGVHPSGDLALMSTAELCTEPLDGSGVAPVSFYLSAKTDGSWVRDLNLAIFSSDGTLLREIETGSGAAGAMLAPGEYSLLAYGATDQRGWPLFSGWVGGGTTLAKAGPTLLSFTEYETDLEVELDPVYYDTPDTSETYWDSIFWLQATGITRGCSPDRFCPNDFVTRGQMAAFLDRALDLPAGGPSGFVDDAGTFQQNIWNLRAAGITTGCAPDRFCTDDSVTRGQMAAFLDRALDLPAGGPSGFVDDAGTFRQNIWNLRAAGITTGCAPDRFCTNDFVTRAQMALFLDRALAATWEINWPESSDAGVDGGSSTSSRLARYEQAMTASSIAASAVGGISASAEMTSRTTPRSSSRSRMHSAVARPIAAPGSASMKVMTNSRSSESLTASSRSPLSARDSRSRQSSNRSSSAVSMLPVAVARSLRN